METVVFMIILKALLLHFDATSLSLVSLALASPVNAISSTVKGGQYSLSGHFAIPSQSGDPQAQATWRFNWDVSIGVIRGTIGITVTYRVNVDVNVENLNKWLPASDSALEVRYSASGGVLSYTISWNGQDIYSGDIQVKPGEQVGPVDIDLASFIGLSLAKLRLYGSLNVFADTTVQGATPQTFGGYVPTSTTLVPSSNVQLDTIFYITPTIRLQLNTPIGSPQKDFTLQRAQGGQVSLKINRVILHSNCGTWISLTTSSPPYKPPRVLTPNETTVCVFSRVLEEKQTAAGYEIYAEYINPTATPSWQPSSIVVAPTGPGSSASQIGVWQIALWVAVGVAAFLAAYLLTGFIFNRRGAKLK
jgi:hypothetical protein